MSEMSRGSGKAVYALPASLFLEVKADARLHIHGKAGLFTVAAGVGEDGGTIGPQFQCPGGVELVELVLIAGDAVNAQLPQQRPGDMTAAQLLTEAAPSPTGR